MKRRFNISAAQMAPLSVLGAVVASSGYVLIGFGSRLVPRSSALFILTLFLCLALVIVGFVISMKSGSSLTNGIAAERWAEEKIAALWSFVRSPLLKVLSVICSVVSLIALVGLCITAESLLYRGLFWVSFIFSMMIFRVRVAVIPFPSPAPPRIADLEQRLATPIGALGRLLNL